MRTMLMIVIILAFMSIYQSLLFFEYQVYYSMIVGGFKTIMLDYLAQRDANLKCQSDKQVHM